MKTLLSLLTVLWCSTIYSSEGKEVSFQSINLSLTSLVIVRVIHGQEAFDLMNFHTVAEARKAAASYIKRFPSATGLIVEIYDKQSGLLTFDIKQIKK